MGAAREVPRPATAPQVTLQPILQATWAFALTDILSTALDLDLFTLIHRGQDNVEALARATSSSERGLRILLNALVANGFLEKHPGSYKVNDVTAQFLSKDGPRYVGGLVLHSRLTQQNWAQLTEAVRTGRPALAIESADDRGEFFAQLVPSLYNLNVDAAELAARELGKAGPVRRALDIGAGSGVWGLAFLRQYPAARLTIADWPIVIEKQTRRFAEREQVSDRVDYLPGDFHDVDFGEAQFDVVTIGHICHSEGTRLTRELFERVHRALRPGGRILIAEFLADEGRHENALALLFAVNMLVNTEHGDTFTYNELRQWLEQAGFKQVHTIEAPAPSPLIAAAK